MSRHAPNERLLQAAHQLDLLARQVTQALDHVRRELTIADSYPTQTPGASVATGGGNGAVCRCHVTGDDGCDICTPITLTATERAAHARYELGNKREQIRDDITAIEQIIASLAKTCRQTIGQRIPLPVPRCDARPYQGSEIAWVPHSRDPQNGWADSTCQEAADASGLCPACRRRERRWRAEHGIQPRRHNAETAAA